MKAKVGGNKVQKRNEIRKKAETLKATKKATRLAKASGRMVETAKPGKKIKSAVPQAKRKK